MGARASLDDVADLIQELLNDDNTETNFFYKNRPNKKWVQRFLQFHPDLTRDTHSQCSGDAWFDRIESWLKDQGNVCAKDFFCDENQRRIFQASELHFPFNMTFNHSTNESLFLPLFHSKAYQWISVLSCLSAEGHSCKLVICFPTTNEKGLNGIIKPSSSCLVGKQTENYHILSSKCGRISSKIFLMWLKDAFYPELCKNGVVFPVVLFLSSRWFPFSIAALKFCREKGIILCCLPYSLSIFQELFITSSSVNKNWTNWIKNWYSIHYKKLLSQQDFIKLFDSLWKNDFSPRAAADAFRKSRIIPFRGTLDSTISESQQTPSFPLASAPNSLESTPKTGQTRNSMNCIEKCFRIVEENLNQDQKLRFERRYVDARDHPHFDAPDNALWNIYKGIRETLDEFVQSNSLHNNPDEDLNNVNDGSTPNESLLSSCQESLSSWPGFQSPESNSGWENFLFSDDEKDEFLGFKEEENCVQVSLHIIIIIIIFIS